MCGLHPSINYSYYCIPSETPLPRDPWADPHACDVTICAPAVLFSAAQQIWMPETIFDFIHYCISSEPVGQFF